MVSQSKKNEVFSFVSERGHVSFAELKNNFEYFSGEMEMSLPDYENIILWSGMSSDFAEMLNDLMKEKRIKYESSSLFVYMADGVMLRLPLAKRLRKYKTRRWLPVVWNTTEKSKK